MTTEPIVAQEPAGGPTDAVTDEQLIAMLVDRARGDGLKLTGDGGLLQQLTKRVLESALDGEITDHVGYDRHDPAGGPPRVFRTVAKRLCYAASCRFRYSSWTSFGVL
jgi:putative transposase